MSGVPVISSIQYLNTNIMTQVQSLIDMGTSATQLTIADFMPYFDAYSQLSKVVGDLGTLTAKPVNTALDLNVDSRLSLPAISENPLSYADNFISNYGTGPSADEATGLLVSHYDSTDSLYYGRINMANLKAVFNQNSDVTKKMASLLNVESANLSSAFQVRMRVPVYLTAFSPNSTNGESLLADVGIYAKLTDPNHNGGEPYDDLATYYMSGINLSGDTPKQFVGLYTGNWFDLSNTETLEYIDVGVRCDYGNLSTLPQASAILNFGDESVQAGNLIQFNMELRMKP